MEKEEEEELFDKWTIELCCLQKSMHIKWPWRKASRARARSSRHAIYFTESFRPGIEENLSEQTKHTKQNN